MSCYLNPDEEDQCVFIAFEGELTTREAKLAHQEVSALMRAKQWNRVVVDLTQLESVPTAYELLTLSEMVFLNLPRSTWIALVVRQNQTKHAWVIESIAQNRGVNLRCFDDAENANAWVKTSPAFSTISEP